MKLLVGPKDELFGRGIASALPESVTLEIASVPRWGYVHYLFPGILTHAVLIAGLFGMGYAMARYRQSLFLKKLSVTPLRRSTFIAAQIAARAALVMVQMILLVATARLVFGLDITPIGAAWLLGFTLLGLLTFMGAGFAMACVIKTEGLMSDAINAVAVPVVFLSEIFFPVDGLPGPLPAIAAALPSTQMVRLTRAVLLYGETRPAAFLPGLAILGAWLCVTYGVSLLAFRWNA